MNSNNVYVTDAVYFVFISVILYCGKHSVNLIPTQINYDWTKLRLFTNQ